MTAKEISQKCGVKELFMTKLDTDKNQRLDEIQYKLVFQEIDKVLDSSSKCNT